MNGITDSSASATSASPENGGQARVSDGLEAFASRFEEVVESHPEVAGKVDPIADAIFSEDLVRDLGRVVGNLAAAASNHDYWKLNEREVPAVGKVGSLYLRHRARVDPGKALDWVALLTAVAIIAPRALREINDQAAARAAQESKPKTEPKPNAAP